MPRAAKREPELDPNAIYVCWCAFATDAMPGSPVIKSGSRLRGDHPAVQACPQYFVSDGADEAERMAKHDEVYGTTAPELVPDFPPPLPPVRDEDALVAIRDIGSLTGGRSGTGQLEAAPNVLLKGQRAHRDSEIAKANPDAFVPVVPKGLKRRDALVAKAAMANIDDDGGRGWSVFQGQWVDRSHPAVKLNPTLFAGVPYAPGETA